MIGKYLYLFYRRILGLLPSCIRSVTIAWWKDLSNIIEIGSGSTTVAAGVLDFDGFDDLVTLGSVPDVTGDCVISLKAFIFNAEDTAYNYIYFKDNASDFLALYMELDVESGITIVTVNTDTNTNPSGGAYFYLDSSYIATELNIEITKTTSLVTSIYVNGEEQSIDFDSGSNDPTPQYYIGGYDDGIGGLLYGYQIYFWDININDEHAYSGQPNGNLDSAWEDSTGSIDGTVSGSPTTIDAISTGTSYYVEESIGTRIDTIYYGQYLDATSGQINLYRTTGTYDYTDPSDGSRSEDNAIPGDGLITVPANGICEIGINRDGAWDGSNYLIYENFYPCCERAGDVLHDVLENSIHIDVDTASWSETLYGSDYLNQCGFADKETSDSLGYDWETTVNGTPVTLDDNCLQPVAHWKYEPLYDVNGEKILDVNGEDIEVRVNF